MCTEDEERIATTSSSVQFLPLKAALVFACNVQKKDGQQQVCGRGGSRIDGTQDADLYRERRLFVDRLALYLLR
jgi:hypothetical protein